MKMSDPGTIVAIALIASMCLGCSHGRTIRETAPAGTRHQDGDVLDYFVPHISTARANEGARVSLFLRAHHGAKRYCRVASPVTAGGCNVRTATQVPAVFSNLR